MKHLHKLLALALAVVMTLGLLTMVGNVGAAYSDAKSITHTAAVDVLSSVNVIAGFPNGTFRPTTTVTRAEMAKILAFLLNGGEDVGEQFADACAFADSQSHWAKGYIGYCVAQGLINGKSPTTFDPEGKVTLAEEAKMVLCALGYTSELRGYTGSEWMIHVATDAATAGLFKDIESLKNTDNMSRDDACQLILNGLKATLVSFPNASSTIVDGDPEIGQIIYSQGMEKKYVTAAERGIAFDFNDRDMVTDQGGINAQLCEVLYPDLRMLNNGHDETGAPADVWTLKNEVVATQLTREPLFTSEISVQGKTLRSKLPTLPLSCTVYVDGVFNSSYSLAQLKTDMGWESYDEKNAINAAVHATRYTLGADGVAFYNHFANANNTRIYAMAAGALIQCWRNDASSSLYSFSTSGGGSAVFASAGYHTAYYYDEDTRDLIITSQAYNPMEVRSIIPAVTDAEGNVTRDGYAVLIFIGLDKPSGYTGGEIEIGDEITVHTANANTTLLPLSKFGEFEGLQVGDRLLATFAHDSVTEPDGEYHIDNAVPVDPVEGEISQIYASSGTSLSSFKLGNATYTRAAKNPVSAITDVVVGRTYHADCYTFGSSNLAFTLEPLSSDYMYLMSAGPMKDQMGEHLYGAKVMKKDATVETIYTTQDYWASVGHLVTGTLNKKTEEYTLNVVGQYSGSQAGDGGAVTVENNKAAVTLGANSLIADSNTVFLVVTRDTNGDQVFNSYKGMEKVPSVSAADYYAYAVENDRLAFVVLEDATLSASTTGVYGMFVKTGKDSFKTDSLGTYYVVKAIVEGKVDTLKLTEAEYNSLNPGLNIFKNLNRDSNGLVTSHVAINGKAITTMTAPEKGVVTFNGTTGLAYHDNVLVYVYHARTDSLEILDSAEQLDAIDPAEVPFQYNTFTSYYTLNPNYDYPVLAGMYISID